MLQQKCGGYKYSATGGSLTGETVSGNRGVVNKVFFSEKGAPQQVCLFLNLMVIGKWG